MGLLLWYFVISSNLFVTDRHVKKLITDVTLVNEPKSMYEHGYGQCEAARDYYGIIL